MKKVILLVLLFSIFYGCEYWSDNGYKIINNTSDTLKIKMDRLGIYYQYNKDTIILVTPLSTMKIIAGGHICGKNCEPEDIRYTADSTEFFGKYFTEISVNNTPLDSIFWNPARWNFTSKRRLGIYTLTITQDMIK